VITGTSGGCVYATLMGLWPKGKEAEMAKQLVTFHNGVDVYKPWKVEDSKDHVSLYDDSAFVSRF